MPRRGFALLASCALLAASPGQAQDSHPADHAAPPASPPVSREAVTADGRAAAPAVAAPDQPPKLLEGYGNGGFAISGVNPQAQAYFTNGMVLAAAFAHKASIAAMQEAVRLDPACAMCLWGLAFTSGPTLNYGKKAEDRVPLLKLARDAQALKAPAGTQRERDLIAALIVRYRRGKVEARDAGFAREMAMLAARYPADDTIAVMAADAAMVATSDEAEYKPAGVRAMAFLEPVLARSPDSTPAIHFYIHASELAGQSARAEPFADRLAGLAPAASHLVHMPSHTWYWVGRYQDATNANMGAVKIDEANAHRLGHSGEHGVFDLPYHAHNVIFGLGGALMAGDSRGGLMLARPLIAYAQDREKAPSFLQLLAAAGYFAVARFDDPAAVLALKEPKLPYLKAGWHYARGEAYAYQRNAEGIRAEIAAIPTQVAQGPIPRDDRAAEQLLGIARAVLTGRLATLENRLADAAEAFRAGAGIEETPDFQLFTDPPAFWYPVRRDLAATLLARRDFAGAIREAEASLKLRPKDPVAMAILAEAQAAAR